MSKRKRKSKKRKAAAKDWYEEDWALPVLVIFGVGMVIVLKDMRKEAQAKAAAIAVTRR